MPIPGSASKINPVSGVSSAVVSTTAEIGANNQKLVKGAILYNKDTGELKIADGISPPSALPDHKHPHTHAPLIHSHIFGANEPWLIGNPRLWYLDDLVNHPELLALDGSEISDDKAEFISQIYPGTKLLTTEPKTLTANGFENDDLTLSVSSFTGDYIGSRLFGDEITFEMISRISDQWLSSSSDITQEQEVIVAFKGGHTYRVTEYWMCPAAGTAAELFKRRPTPKDWILEGSADGGTTWVALDTHTNEPAINWNPITTRVFPCSEMNSYASIRLRVTAWNAGDSADLQTGLRRLWIFGRKKDVFALPNLESPHPDFVYVIPQKNLNVGLKHEDIGDVGSTSILPNLLGNYRTPTDGRGLNKTEYATLFATIGHKYDTQQTPSEVSVSTGTMAGTSWQSGIVDVMTPAYVDVTIPSGVLGKYHLDITGYCTPKSWIVEGKNGSDWVILQILSDVAPTAFASSGGEFFIELPATEVAYSIYRINFLEWNTGSDPIGFNALRLFTHAAGQFFIPNISTPGLTTYIVSNNTAVDVSAQVIQSLQNNVAALSATIATLAARVNELDPQTTP